MSVRRNILLKIRNSAVLAYDSNPLIISANVFHKKGRRPTVATNIPERVSIHERPAEADGRRFGDWEMDLIVGKVQKSAILTLCERSRNYLIMERLPCGKNHEKVADAVIRLLYPYRKNVLTITTDNGFEFRSHKKIS